MAGKTDTFDDLMLLARAAQIVLQDEVLDDLGEAAITPLRANILRLVARRGRQSVNDVAFFLGQSKPSASQNIDLLVRSGLACREADTVDRRCVWVSLTARGRGFLERAERRQMEVLERSIANLQGTQLERLSRDMRSFALALLAHSDRPRQCLQCCAYDSAGCVRRDGAWQCPHALRGARGSKGSRLTRVTETRPCAALDGVVE